MRINLNKVVPASVLVAIVAAGVALALPGRAAHNAAQPGKLAIPAQQAEAPLASPTQAGAAASTATPTAASYIPPAGWQIAWRDDFAGGKLDTSKWLVSDSTRPDSSDGYIVGDHFSAGYAAANVTVSGGRVHLRTDHATYTGKQYRSAGVSTYGKYEFTSGRIIVRARLPRVSTGIWPAIWMIAADSGDNAMYEYDLMECAGGSEDFPNGAHTVQLTQHDWTAGNWQTARQSSAHDYAAGFHDYEIDRTANSVTYKLDGKTLFTVTGSHSGGTRPAWLIINTQVGSSGNGDSWSPSPDGSTILPVSFDIESVTYLKPTSGN